MSAPATEAPAAEDPAGRRELRPLAAVLTATAVSLTGTRISAVALPWFVLATSGSATRTGLVAFCEMAPYVLVKALTGPLLDRVGPRRASWTADAASAVAAALVPLLHALGLLHFGTLLALVAAVGAVRGPGDLAKHVMVPEAAERSRVPLERAAGLAGVTERLASTVGPAAGGALVALVGPLAGVAVNAACFALGAVVVGLGLPRGAGRSAASPQDAEGGAGQGYWQRFGEGLRFLRGDRLLLTVSVMVAVTNLLDAGFTTVLVPVWAKESGGGPAAIGLTGSAWGVAAVCGSLVAAAVAHRMRRRTVFFAGFLVAGAPKFLVLALGAPTGAVLAVFAAGGFGAGFLNPILGAVAFERVPRRLLGRVGAIGDSLAWAGIPLGGLLGGAAVAAAGLAPVLLAAGGAYLLTTTLTGLRPEWRGMDRRRGRGAGAAAVPSPAGPREPAVPQEPAGLPDPAGAADGGRSVADAVGTPG
ncbi:MFS transporter [Streptacidiphilus sp. ASG 303]|uniref:MFS transporter n=1 Tax=Streptacidiphilus sp. ASG 303 TaxID=2896847 RepID=UPI001E5C2C65|nr:MFS transporter [Streptacidiphilus sp. ASG 303]MCD0481359.1 MFS transporter [Streptacidiphilus sp. ASG 303]